MDDSGNETIDFGDIDKAMAKLCGPTFSKKNIDLHAAKLFARTHTTKLYHDDIDFPGERDFRRFWSRVPHSGVGKDGIPYAAYDRIGAIAAPIFVENTIWLADGNKPDGDFNDVLQIYIPKPTGAESDGLLTVSASEARPLGLKDCSNKSIAAVTNNVLKRPLA